MYNISIPLKLNRYQPSTQHFGHFALELIVAAVRDDAAARCERGR